MWREHTLLWSVPLFPLATSSTLGWTLLPSVWVLSGDPSTPPSTKSHQEARLGTGWEKDCSQGPRGHRRSGRPGGTLPPRLPFTLPTEVSSKPPPPRGRGRKSPGGDRLRGVAGNRGGRSHAFLGQRLGRPFSPYQLPPPRPRPARHPNARSILLLVWPQPPTRTWASSILNAQRPGTPTLVVVSTSAMSAVREPGMLK